MIVSSSRHGCNTEHDPFSRVLVVSIKLQALAPILALGRGHCGLDAEINVVLTRTLRAHCDLV